MKSEKKEFTRTIKETREVFIADDGEEFFNAEQCKEYEESAKYAYRKRLTKVLTPIDRKRANLILDEICDNGRNECDYFVFKPQTEDDLKNFIAYARAATGHFLACDFKNNSEYNYICVSPEELVVGETYVFFNRDNEWGGIVSHKSLTKAVDKCFDESLWVPVKEEDK